MTRKEAMAFIESLVNLRVSITDEQALNALSIYPKWKNNVLYNINDRVLYNDILYKVIITHTSQSDWTPDVTSSLFAKILIPDGNVIPEWEQPDSTNPYMLGDKVLYEGKTWESTIDNNVWAPNAYGWKEI